MRRSSVRLLVGTTFLAAQLGMMVYARFNPSRYFCWAPNDYMVDYTLKVAVQGRVLTPEESRSRYRLPASQPYQNTAQHLIEIVRQYEQTYGRDDHARVRLKYRVNGREEQEWRWPGK